MKTSSIEDIERVINKNTLVFSELDEILWKKDEEGNFEKEPLAALVSDRDRVQNFIGVTALGGGKRFLSTENPSWNCYEICPDGGERVYFSNKAGKKITIDKTKGDGDIRYVNGVYFVEKTPKARALLRYFQSVEQDEWPSKLCIVDKAGASNFEVCKIFFAYSGKRRLCGTLGTLSDEEYKTIKKIRKKVSQVVLVGYAEYFLRQRKLSSLEKASGLYLGPWETFSVCGKNIGAAMVANYRARTNY